MSVVVSHRQMQGSAAPRRTFHRPKCPRLKVRTADARTSDHVMSRAEAVEAGYRACQWCKP